MTIGQHMRAARKKAGLTIAELARLANICYPLLWAYEHETRTPGLFNLISICDVLGIGIDEYVGYKPKEGE